MRAGPRRSVVRSLLVRGGVHQQSSPIAAARLGGDSRCAGRLVTRRRRGPRDTASGSRAELSHISNIRAIIVFGDYLNRGPRVDDDYLMQTAPSAGRL